MLFKIHFWGSSFNLNSPAQRISLNQAHQYFCGLIDWPLNHNALISPPFDMHCLHRATYLVHTALLIKQWFTKAVKRMIKTPIQESLHLQEGHLIICLRAPEYQSLNILLYCNEIINKLNNYLDFLKLWCQKKATRSANRRSNFKYIFNIFRITVLHLWLNTASAWLHPCTRKTHFWITIIYDQDEVLERIKVLQYVFSLSRA